MTLLTPYDTHHGVLINRAKFDACTTSSFKGVTTDRNPLYVLHTAALPAESLSVTSELSVGSAGQAGFTNQVLVRRVTESLCVFCTLDFHDFLCFFS